MITGKGSNDYPYEIVPVRKLNKKLSRCIEHVINKCARQNPKERYQSVEMLLKDLNNIDKFDIEYKRKQLKRDIKAVS